MAGANEGYEDKQCHSHQTQAIVNNDSLAIISPLAHSVTAACRLHHLVLQRRYAARSLILSELPLEICLLNCVFKYEEKAGVARKSLATARLC